MLSESVVDSVIFVEGELPFPVFFSLAFVVTTAASMLIKTSHVNYWEHYLIHVKSRILYPLVTRATTVATGVLVPVD